MGGESDGHCKSCSMSKQLKAPRNVRIGSGSCVIPLNFLEKTVGNFVMAKEWNWPISAVIHLTVECVAPAATD